MVDARYYSIAFEYDPEKWRLFVGRKKDPAFQQFAQKVWERDRYTCQFCGFQAHHYQEVINLDGNYRKATLSNAVTACCLCAQCFFLDAVGKDEYGGGYLIHLPQMSQNDLNGLCHVLFCAMVNATDYREQAQVIYRDLKLRSQIVEKRLGQGMSDPAKFAQSVIEGNIEDEEKIQTLLKDLRLLPSVTKFSEQIETWARAAREELESYAEA